MTYSFSQVLTYVVIALMVGLALGSFLTGFFEDVLRGPIMRAYDDWVEVPVEDAGPFDR